VVAFLRRIAFTDGAVDQEAKGRIVGTLVEEDLAARRNGGSPEAIGGSGVRNRNTCRWARR
jgi:hypothetical protein